MIRRKQRIPMRDLSLLSGEDAYTASKRRVNGRDKVGIVVGARSARIG